MGGVLPTCLLRNLPLSECEQIQALTSVQIQPPAVRLCSENTALHLCNENTAVRLCSENTSCESLQ